MPRLLLLLCLFTLTACATSGRFDAPPKTYNYQFTADQCGRVVSTTDPRGIVTDYTYDAINRLTDVEYPSDGSLDVSLTYDSVSGCGSAPKGRLCSVTDASGTTAYQYNDLGQLI